MELTTPDPPDSAPELSWANCHRHCRRQWLLGRSAADLGAHSDRRSRGIQPLIESIEDVGTNLNGVGTAQLLNREADLERGRESVNGINGRDLDLRRDIERPIEQNASETLELF